MVAFAIAISAGILFLLRALIAFWMETARAHRANDRIKSRRVGNVMPFRTMNRTSETLNVSVRLRNAEATNETDEGHGFRYMTH